MTNINPQYMFDNTGNAVGVFLPIEDWNTIYKKLHFELPGWQKNMIETRLKQYKDNPPNTLDWENVLVEFEREDNDI